MVMMSLVANKVLSWFTNRPVAVKLMSVNLSAEVPRLVPKAIVPALAERVKLLDAVVSGVTSPLKLISLALVSVNPFVPTLTAPVSAMSEDKVVRLPFK